MECVVDPVPGDGLTKDFEVTRKRVEELDNEFVVPLAERQNYVSLLGFLNGGDKKFVKSFHKRVF